MLLKCKTAFTCNGDYFAYSSPDGCLKIWETSTNILKQDYTPSSHLSATCSSLSWGPSKNDVHLSKKTKRSRTKQIDSSISNLQLIAMGTMTGDILLYSVAQGELHAHFSSGHADVVNDIAWYAEDNSLFSCSNDQHITIWNISKGKVKEKWKAGNSPVYSICVIDSKNLLSASSTILWWDIKTQTIIKKFLGHATEVFQLVPVLISGTLESCYFVSAAVGDRVINAWQLNKNEDPSAVVSFISSEEPERLELSKTRNQALLLSAVAKDGSFHVFEHVLNGKKKKPLEPKMSLHVVSSSGDKPYPISILAAKVSTDACLIVYGSFLKPKFETVALSQSSKDVYLPRDISSLSSVTVNKGLSKIRAPIQNADVKLLAPGHMTQHQAGTSTKKRKKGLSITELPMEQRLKALELADQSEDEAVESNSLLHLLLQALQSKDKTILIRVLSCSNMSVIEKTLERLPLHCLKLLLTEIHHNLSRKSLSYTGLLWLAGIQSVHLPFLMACKDIVDFIGPINQLMEAKFEYLSPLSELSHSLQILSEQFKAITCQEKQEGPLLVYQSGESSEESDMEELNLNEGAENSNSEPESST